MNTASGFLEPSVQEALRLLEMRARHLADSGRTGGRRSRLRGRGMEFDQVVRYAYGDDVRDIDWNVTARLGETHRKTYTEDREASVQIVFDDHPALDFGSGRRTKRSVLIEALGLTMMLAAETREPLTVIHRTCRGERIWTDLSDRARILAAFTQILQTYPVVSRETVRAVAPPVERLADAPRGGVLIWIGDTPAAVPPPTWSRLSRRFETLAIRAEDRWEREGPDASAHAWDPVSGMAVDIAGGARARAAHRLWRERRERTWRAWWPDPGARLTLFPDEDPFPPFARFFARGQS